MMVLQKYSKTNETVIVIFNILYPQALVKTGLDKCVRGRRQTSYGWILYLISPGKTR